MSTSPDPAVCLAELFPAVERTFARWMHSLVEGSGVSPARMRLLGVLHCKGPQIMCGLSDDLGVTARNVTTLVDGLEAEGQVRRMPHPADRRATVVELTPAGYKLAEELLGPFYAQIVGLFREFPVADQREFLRLLRKLFDHLQRRAPGGPVSPDQTPST
jgi:DNA-binding MarR family transcriptional regulator